MGQGPKGLVAFKEGGSYRVVWALEVQVPRAVASAFLCRHLRAAVKRVKGRSKSQFAGSVEAGRVSGL